MARKLIRNIDLTLDRASLRNAIREIKAVQEELVLGMNDLIQKLTKDGAEIAKMQVVSMDAVDTGELESSIYGFYEPQSRIGYVIAGAPHAIYVEFGTGIIGAGEQHPMAAEARWEYDVNSHGLGGWVYRKGSSGIFSEPGKGEYRWTQGYIPRPFMYNTLRWLQEAAETVGAEIILKNM